MTLNPITKVRVHMSDLETFLERGDHLNACRALGRLAESYVNLASDVAQLAHDDGATKKDIAAALGISPRDLVGMTRRTSV